MSLILRLSNVLSFLFVIICSFFIVFSFKIGSLIQYLKNVTHLIKCKIIFINRCITIYLACYHHSNYLFCHLAKVNGATKCFVKRRFMSTSLAPPLTTYLCIIQTTGCLSLPPVQILIQNFSRPTIAWNEVFLSSVGVFLPPFWHLYPLGLL